MDMFKFFKKNMTIDENHLPLLRIMVREHHVADLYHDGNDYCLIYKESFNLLSIPPLNPENLGANGTVEIDRSYKSKNLWYVFQERLNSLDREDVAKELTKYGLNKNSNPLLILGKLGKSSISKPWHLELVSEPKAK